MVAIGDTIMGEQAGPQLLEEALEIIRSLFDGDTAIYRGKHLATENAKSWDLPAHPSKIGVAVSDLLPGLRGLDGGDR